MTDKIFPVTGSPSETLAPLAPRWRCYRPPGIHQCIGDCRADADDDIRRYCLCTCLSVLQRSTCRNLVTWHTRALRLASSPETTSLAATGIYIKNYRQLFPSVGYGSF